MDLIPVIDLRNGQAVHARLGHRDQYQPVHSVLLPGQPGQAMALARAYRAMLGASRCYLADLDAIEGGTPDLPLLRRLVDPAEGFGRRLMVDAGINGPEAALLVLETGVEAVVVGLETLTHFSRLAEVVGAAGGSRVVFSLDLREGVPLRRRMPPALENGSPLHLAACAIEAGVAAISVLDMAAVGSGAGPRHLELIRGIRGLGVPVYAGGGVRGPEDLQALADAGCDAVLVASAIHDGTIRSLVGPAQSPSASR